MGRPAPSRTCPAECFSTTDIPSLLYDPPLLDFPVTLIDQDTQSVMETYRCIRALHRERVLVSDRASGLGSSAPTLRAKQSSGSCAALCVICTWVKASAAASRMCSMALGLAQQTSGSVHSVRSVVLPAVTKGHVPACTGPLLMPSDSADYVA